MEGPALFPKEDSYTNTMLTVIIPVQLHNIKEAHHFKQSQRYPVPSPRQSLSSMGEVVMEHWQKLAKKASPLALSFSLCECVCIFLFHSPDTNLQVRSFNSSCLDLQRESVNLQEHLQVWGSCTNKCFLLSEQGSQWLQKAKGKRSKLQRFSGKK